MHGGFPTVVFFLSKRVGHFAPTKTTNKERVTMGISKTIVLWSNNGKLEATVFASRRDAFTVEKVDDQMGMIAVKVTTAADFDPERDYLLRQVKKNGGTNNELVFGSMPKWAGGELLAPRCIVADGSETTRLLAKFPATTQQDRETRRLNGITVDNAGECNCGKKCCDCGDDCCGK